MHTFSQHLWNVLNLTKTSARYVPKKQVTEIFTKEKSCIKSFMYITIDEF
jgi:hypothetical protein